MQLDLLDQIYGPPSNGTPTSDAAADSVVDILPNWRLKVLAVIVGSGRRGLTDEEIAEKLGMNPSTVRPRRGELDKAGFIEKHPHTRPTASGRQAVVWVSTFEGRCHLQEAA